MKKVSSIIAALALVLGLSQCTKPEMPAAGVGQKITQEVTLTAGYGSGSKVSFEEEEGTGLLNLTWDDTDVITVYEGANEAGTLHYSKGVGTANAEFTGIITATVGNTLTFRVKSMPTLTSQDGTFEWIETNYCLEGTEKCNDEGIYDVFMGLPYAILKLNLSALGSTGEGNTVTVKVGTETKAKILKVKDDSNVMYVALPTDNLKDATNPAEVTYTFEGNSKSIGMSWAIKQNTFYTAKDTEGEAIVVAQTPGTLSGVFSVSETTTVKFSQGNLQYQASSDTWRIAENQYDYVGNESYGNVYVGGTKCNNANASSGYNGWIDLFGWGCTGHKDTRSLNHTNWYQTRFMPWNTENSEYPYPASSYNIYGYGPDYFSNQPYNLTVANKSDWGCNTIYVGSTATTGWRTLTKEEWTYLLNTRSGNRYAKAKVNDVQGLIIFPDGYTGTASGTGIAAVNTHDAGVPSSNIPTETWTAMENAGVVFLPHTGYRSGNTGLSGFSGYNCCYWSSSNKSSYNAYYICVVTNKITTDNGNERRNGYSVRLVR